MSWENKQSRAAIAVVEFRLVADKKMNFILLNKVHKVQECDATADTFIFYRHGQKKLKKEKFLSIDVTLEALPD